MLVPAHGYPWSLVPNHVRRHAKISERLVYYEPSTLHVNGNDGVSHSLVRVVHQQMVDGLQGSGDCDKHHVHRQHGDSGLHVFNQSAAQKVVLTDPRRLCVQKTYDLPRAGSASCSDALL
jgi:hypothetical protein